ncbi:MAG: ATP-binding protein [Polaromonas sp.]
MIFDEHEQAVDCRFLEANPAFGKQTGIHDAAGKRLREITPASEAGWLKICGQVARTGETVRFVYEEKALDSLWFDIYAARLGGPGSPKVAIVFNNITERTRAGEALRQSEQRFRALFDLGPIAMYCCDTSGVIQEFNLCAVELWGREPKPDDVDERFCGASKVYYPDGSLLSHAQNPVVAVLKGEIPQAHDLEAVIERPDGSRIQVIANIVPLKNGRGEITGAINCFYDITERSRLERKTQAQAQALADLHRRKDEFLAMLSHELRNPLAPLASAVQMLHLQKNEEPLQQHARKVIERQVGQMKHLIDDLLEISRINSGNVRLRQEWTSVSDVVERALETVQPLIVQRRHEFTVSLPPQPVWLHADATRLEQVLVNLLANAAKYTDEGGRIWLSVELDDDAGLKAGGQAAVLRVRDTGICIAPELLPHVFELFTQAERAIDRSQGGLGIGLSLVRQLVELHAGSVKAYSVPGQGSEFVVRLPAMPPPPAPLTPSIQPVPPGGKSCRVLAVDDHVDAVQNLALLLEIAGHEVQIAYDGTSALEAALAMRPDVVLLDLGLPGLTGFEVAKWIRQQAALKNVVLVALTGYGREADRQRSKAAGFDYHLVKPAGFSEVEKILAMVAQQLA